MARNRVVNTSKHSLNPDREKQPKGSTMRTKATIKRLNMYRNFKAKRDATGKIVRAAPFQSTLPSGTVSRIEPNRRWFGNTRVISQDALQNFKEAMKIRNPYEIILKQTKLPISLLDERKTKSKPLLLSAESYAHAFGAKAQRKRPKLNCDDLTSLVHQVEERQHRYTVDEDKNRITSDDGVRDLASEPHFKAGQSKRLWNELFKVLDSSDVVLYVLDARDPMGTRSAHIEKYLRTEKLHKHFIFVINKVDLVPVWITKRWKAILSEEYPTLIFHADINKPIGKVAMLGLLRQLSSLHRKHRPQISVGIIGYPNVGKSSIINALRSKKVCQVAPLAGETKVWQYVNLMKSIFLIDCPGVVYPEGATEAELVLKGVVRVEYLRQPDLYIGEVLQRVRADYLQSRYNLPADTLSEWSQDPQMFLELVAKQTGKLLKGGEPDVMTTAKRILNDFQRGKLPYFVKPPLNEDDTTAEHDDPEANFEEEEIKDLALESEDEQDGNVEKDGATNTDSAFSELSETVSEDEDESDSDPTEETSGEEDGDAEPLTGRQRRQLEKVLNQHRLAKKRRD